MNSSPYSQDTFKSSSILGGVQVRYSPPALLPENLTSLGEQIFEESSSAYKGNHTLQSVVDFNSSHRSSGAQGQNNGLCTWRTSGELICPLQIKSDSNIQVVIFQQLTASQQIDLISKLYHLWHESYRAMGITSLQMLELFIKETFVQGNVLYVAVRGDGSILGCTAIDFLRSVPFISQQMSVNNDKEVQKHLEDSAIVYGSRFNYPTVQVWCNRDNVNFYQERGWKYLMEKQTKSGWKVVMEKKYY